jgi:hypothetical protein
VVLGVRNPQKTSPVHGDVIGAVELCVPIVSVDHPGLAGWAPSDQDDVPVRVYLPDLVVADVCYVEVSRPVTSQATRVVEPGVVRLDDVGAVVARHARLAGIGGNHSAGGGLDYDVLDGVGAVDVARRVNRGTAESRAPAHETALPVEQIVLAKDY